MLTKQFTDIYGVTHAAAVFAIDGININNHSSRRIYLDELGAIKEDETVTYSVDFSARFWASQQAKDEGRLHMSFVIMESLGSYEQGAFNLEYEENPIVIEQSLIIEKAEARLLELITQGQG